MKKRVKKLRVHRETVWNLSDSRLQGVLGGYTMNPGECGTSCGCIDESGTFSATCTAQCPTTSLG